jgi:urate oxidase
MTTKQRQELSEVAEIAAQNDDIESLSNIYKIILQDQKESVFFDNLGDEWFVSLLTPEQHNQILSIVSN